MPVVVEDTSSSSEYGSVSPDNDLNANPFIFKPSLKCYSERDVKGTRSLFLRWDGPRRCWDDDVISPFISLSQTYVGATEAL